MENNYQINISRRCVKFLVNMNLHVIGKGWSSDVVREEDGIIVNENFAYQRREWNTSLYYNLS